LLFVFIDKVPEYMVYYFNKFVANLLNAKRELLYEKQLKKKLVES